MTWMFYVIDLIGNILEETVTISYFRSISGNRRKSLPALIALCILLTLFRMALYFLNHDTFVTLAASAVTVTAISLMYDISWIKRMIFIPIMLIMIVFSEILIGLLLTALTNISVNEGVNMILFYTGGVLISKMVMFSMLKLIQFIVPSFGEKISGYLMVPLMMLPVATFMMTYALGEYNLHEGASVRTFIAAGALILLAFANVGLFFLLEYQQREEKEKSRMRLMQQQTEGQIEYYRELAERQQISNKTMHDLKNQMFALSEAMRTAPGKTREIMENISGRIFAASPMTITGIDAVDSLLFAKRQQMERYGIRYDQSVYVSPYVSFDPLDLCVLLGNLLDNAIEANQKVDPGERYISLNMTQQELWLSITIKNAAAGEVQLDGKTIRTTKAHKEMHGFGLGSVHEITDKYQGDCTFRSTGRDFTAYLLLQDT